LSPAGGDGSFDEPGGGGALVGGFAAFGFAGAGALVLDVADGQPQQFDHGVVGREVTPILDDLPELEVEALDGVGGCR